MIIDELKKANIQAMRDKATNLRAIYSVVINKYLQSTIESRTTGKELDDSDTIRILQKTIKELEEESSNYKKANNLERVELIEKQKSVLEQYLPKMMSKDEIKNIVIGLEDQSIQFVMKYFKQHYDGKCEMRDVQEVLKSLKA